MRQAEREYARVANAVNRSTGINVLSKARQREETASEPEKQNRRRKRRSRMVGVLLIQLWAKSGNGVK